jgi:hypothetical protein
MRRRILAFAGSVLAAASLVTGADPETERLSERARQDRTIEYFLRDPDTHAFDLHHDYTETKEGEDKYVNVVRKGSTASNPSARILDTGESLKVETLRGDAITKGAWTSASRSVPIPRSSSSVIRRSRRESRCG